MNDERVNQEPGTMNENTFKGVELIGLEPTTSTVRLSRSSN